jgi:hypothetical protein
MMNDKITIEIEEVMLAQLLEHAMIGIQETGEYTPMLAWTFKELANKLSDNAWDVQAIKEFAANLNDSCDDDEDDY